MVWSLRGRPQVVFEFIVRDGRLAGVEMLGDPETLDVLDLEPARRPGGRARSPGPR